VTSFSPFALGSTDAASVLPIELKSFTAIKNGKNNLIQWETAIEENVRVFQVEKSENGVNWTNLAQVLPQITKRYSTIDKTPFATTYYRLRNIDNDGREAVSQIISLSSDKIKFDATIVTVSKENLRLNIFSENNDDAMIQVIDITGRTATTQHFALAATNNILDIPVNLVSGIYLVKIQTTSGEQFSQLIKL
jgi:hypothetical protein